MPSRLARITALPSVLSVVVLGLVVSGSDAYAGAAAAAPSADQAAVDAVLAASPTDASIAGASDADLVRAAVRCVSLETATYCLHYGWGTPPDSALQASTADVGQATAGDTSLTAAVRAWAAKPFKQRRADEQDELAQAQAALGKVLLLNHVVLGSALPANFTTRFPEVAPILAKIESGGGAPQAASGQGAAVISPDVQTNCDNGTNVGCGYAPMLSSRMAKQTQPYNCGAASMQAIAWNDPKASVYKNQAQWESILGTTSANGTNAYNLMTAINNYTHWDDSDYAGKYAIVSIANYTVANFRSMFTNHLRIEHAPVQMNPKLNPTTTTYYKGYTDGHYDVVIGYDYSVGDWVQLYEPAGGAAQGHIYDPVTAWDDTTHIRLASMANPNKLVIE